MNSTIEKRKGIATVELAVVFPFLLVLVFAVVDFGRLILVDNEITNVSREAANLAWRGEELIVTVDAILDVNPDLEANGFIIMSRIQRDQNDNPMIVRQRMGGLQPRTSRIGSVGGAANIPVIELPRPGQHMIVAEVFMNYTPITPIGALFGSSLPPYLYDVAYFY
jgi:general stress protein CsbA